eukprot:TRINITY_DN14708_c0_g1_i1.p1 TRINITY_DN14708_c0_g1~~TRINITY_DN14708_c0_g1_i1.p1  ORF type:complete len:198 (+),score=7.12 TRINITY_DN14708_c0_g1_i1:39-596(+)
MNMYQQNYQPPPPMIIKSLCQLMQALEICHAHQIIHHDVKQSNLVFKPPQHILLVDFGLSFRFHQIPPKSNSNGLQKISCPHFYPVIGSDTETEHCCSPDGFCSVAVDMQQAGLVLAQWLDHSAGPNVVYNHRRTQHMSEKLLEYWTKTNFTHPLLPLLWRMLATDPCSRPDCTQVLSELLNTKK